MPSPKKIFLIISVFIILSAIVLAPAYVNETKDNNLLKVIFLSVGQGDSTLIKTPNGKIILIDGGPDNSVVYKLGEYLPWWQKEIDLVVLTHPHSDHVAGLVEVLKRYRVGEVAMTGVLHTAPDYLGWLEILKLKKIKILIPPADRAINIDPDLKMEVLNPAEDLYGKKIENMNNSSLVIKMTYGKISFLMTGDLESDRQNELLNFDLKSNVLKVPHHGSSDGLNRNFLSEVAPSLAIISVGKNSYGHPSPRTISALERTGAKIFTTLKNGDIEITTSGAGLKVDPDVD